MLAKTKIIKKNFIKRFLDLLHIKGHNENLESACTNEILQFFKNSQEDWVNNVQKRGLLK